MRSVRPVRDAPLSRARAHAKRAGGPALKAWLSRCRWAAIKSDATERYCDMPGKAEISASWRGEAVDGDARLAACGKLTYAIGWRRIGSTLVRVAPGAAMRWCVGKLLISTGKRTWQTNELTTRGGRKRTDDLGQLKWRSGHSSYIGSWQPSTHSRHCPGIAYTELATSRLGPTFYGQRFLRADRAS
jgi:hypothetical protein